MNTEESEQLWVDTMSIHFQDRFGPTLEAIGAPVSVAAWLGWAAALRLMMLHPEWSRPMVQVASRVRQRLVESNPLAMLAGSVEDEVLNELVEAFPIVVGDEELEPHHPHASFVPCGVECVD